MIQSSVLIPIPSLTELRQSRSKKIINLKEISTLRVVQHWICDAGWHDGSDVTDCQRIYSPYEIRNKVLTTSLQV